MTGGFAVRLSGPFRGTLHWAQLDLHNLGSSCGCSGVKIPPRWVLSRMKPEAIQDDAPLPNARRRWWQALFG